MKLLITGVCGFVGSQLALWFREHKPEIAISGIDNLSRPGSETNRLKLKSAGVLVRHADTRSWADVENLSAIDWIIDAAANPRFSPALTRRQVRANWWNTISMARSIFLSCAGVSVAA